MTPPKDPIQTMAAAGAVAEVNQMTLDARRTNRRLVVADYQIDPKVAVLRESLTNL